MHPRHAATANPRSPHRVQPHRASGKSIKIWKEDQNTWSVQLGSETIGKIKKLNDRYHIPDDPQVFKRLSRAASALANRHYGQTQGDQHPPPEMA